MNDSREAVYLEGRDYLSDDQQNVTMIPLFKKFIHEYHKGDVIFEENDTDNEMYIVYSGSVGIYKNTDDKCLFVAQVGEGDFFGEMAVIDNSPRSAGAIAAEETQLIVLDEAKFLYLLRHQPHFALIVMQRLCDMLRRTTEGWAFDEHKR
ncbi:Crp/Fnr family transcriptional regulator [Chloroflexota bacterium]